MSEHPGKPNFVMSVDVFLKTPLTEDQHRELAVLLRGFGALAVNVIETFDENSVGFAVALHKAREAMDSEHKVTFDELRN